MGFGQTVASVARYAAVTAAAMITLYTGASFVLYKQTPTGPTTGTSIQVWKTSSGGQVGNLDEIGNLTTSGAIAMQNTKNCPSLKTTGTGMVACGASTSGLSFAAAQGIYVNQSGDTMTGSLNILNGKSLQVAGSITGATLSGFTLHADGVLSASGNILGEQVISGSVLKAGEFSPRIMMAQVVASGSAVGVGSGKLILVVPRVMSGYTLGEAHVAVQTAGTTNTSTFRLRNITKNNRQFFGANPLSIDSAEVGSDTAATAPTFAANRDVGAYDRLSFDIMTVSTTAPKGLVLTLYFYK